MNKVFSPCHTVIFGASSGLGHALASRLVNNNNLSLFARRLDRLEDFSREAENIYVASADVTNFEEMHSLLSKAVKKFGKIQKLVYCAGHQIIKPHRMTSELDYDQMYAVNLRGALAASKAFCRSSISESTAVMCIVSSVAAQKPEPGILGYSVMKSGLSALIKGLAVECRPRRFVGVAPAWLDTEMTKRQSIYDSDFIEQLSNKSPLGLTSIECVLDTIEFLISCKAKSITGQIITVDGGYTLL